MFVLEALVLTFATTPTVSYLYPPHLRTRATVSGTPFANIHDRTDAESAAGDRTNDTKLDEEGVVKRRFTVVLDKLEHLPSMMAITQLLQVPYTQTESASSQSFGNQAEVATHFGALRLIELADRPSDVMKSSATDALLHTDPLIAVFRTFAELNGLPVSAALSIVPLDSLATSVAEHVSAVGTELVLVPWLPSTQAPEIPDTGAPSLAQDRNAPFDSLFHSDRSTSLVHSQFVRGVFAQAGTNVALLFGHAPFSLREQTNLFLPFFGGPDNRLALDFVVQLCANPRVCATVMRLTKRDIQATIPAPEAAHIAGDDDKAEEYAQASAATVTSLRSVGVFSCNQQHPSRVHTKTDRGAGAGGNLDDARLSGYNVRQRDDADAAAIPDGRLHHMGAIRHPVRSHTWRCLSALACDFRRVRQPRPATCGAAACAPDAAPRCRCCWAVTPTCGRGSACGAPPAGGGARWCSGARRHAQDDWRRRDGICDDGHRRKSARDAGFFWYSLGPVD